jgi:hypothetical protein
MKFYPDLEIMQEELASNSKEMTVKYDSFSVESYMFVSLPISITQIPI